MALNKQKKIEYIKQVLEEVANDNIDCKEDSILIEVALDFIAEIGKGGESSNGKNA